MNTKYYHKWPCLMPIQLFCKFELPFETLILILYSWTNVEYCYFIGLETLRSDLTKSNIFRYIGNLKNYHRRRKLETPVLIGIGSASEYFHRIGSPIGTKHYIHFPSTPTLCAYITAIMPLLPILPSVA